MRKLRAVIAWGLFIPVTFMLVAVIGLQLLSTVRQVEVLGFAKFLVSPTQSMEPNMYHNDLIIVRRANFNDLQIGDIVLFETTARTSGGAVVTVLVAHEIIGEAYHEPTGTRGFRTSGTAEGISPDQRLMTADGATVNGMPTNQFIGLVAFHNAPLGQFFAYLQSPFGIVAFLMCVIILWMIFQLSAAPRMRKIYIGSREYAEVCITEAMAVLEKTVSEYREAKKYPGNTELKQKLEQQVSILMNTVGDAKEAVAGYDGV